MQSRLQILSLILLFILSFKSIADEKPVYFKLNHQNCILVSDKVETEDKKFNKSFIDTLEKKNYKLMYTSKVNKGSLYLKLKRERHSGLYKDCSVSLTLKQAKDNYKSKSDKTLHQKTVRRKYPRITRTGNERCRRALKEAFIHIPTCTIPGKN